MNTVSNHIDFIHFIRLWNILWNRNLRQKLIILFVAHIQGLFLIVSYMKKKFFLKKLDERRKKQGFNLILEPISFRSSSLASDSKSIDLILSTNEQILTLSKDNEQLTNLHSSELPLIKQVNLICLHNYPIFITEEFFLYPTKASRMHFSMRMSNL